MKPLTPPECNLQDFAFMPLDVARLRDSDLASNESPEACWAAVQLWAASWHQVPAASIPDDDKWMAQQTGYGRIVKEWLKIKSGALRGWVICDDGRLYHPVVAEKAREAWQAKLEQRWRTECARIKKHNDRHGTTIEKPLFDEWASLGCPSGHMLPVPRDKADCPSDVPRETPSKGEGEGQGQGQIVIPVAKATDGDAVKPADMTKDELWKAGKSLLSEAGMPRAQCGTFVGKLVKDYGDVTVIEAVRAAVVARPADPASYLKATCQTAAGQRQKPAYESNYSASQRKKFEEAAPMVAAQNPNLPSVDINAFLNNTGVKNELARNDITAIG